MEGYCWAITQVVRGVGVSCRGRSGASVLDFRFQLDSLVYTHITDHMYTQNCELPDTRLEPDLQERNYFPIRGVSYFVAEEI